MAPYRWFGGSSVAEIFIFFRSNKKCPLFVKIISSYFGSSKSYHPPQFFAQKLNKYFLLHQSFSESPSNFCLLEVDWSKRFSTPREGPRPPKSPTGSAWVQTKNFWKKSKFYIAQTLKTTVSWVPLHVSQKPSQSFSKSPSNFCLLEADWIKRLSTPGRVRDPPNHRLGLFESKRLFLVKKSDPQQLWKASSTIFRNSDQNLQFPQIPLVNSPVNFDRKNEVRDHLKIKNWSCRLQPSIESVVLVPNEHI